MRSKALVALGRIVLAKRERVIALEPHEKGLIGTTLRYPYEVRDSQDYFADIPELSPAPELLRLAEHILDGKLQAFDPCGFRDRYEEALMAHLKAKQAGMPPQPKQRWAVPRRAINLMEALRRSIAEDKKAEARRPAPARKRGCGADLRRREVHWIARTLRISPTCTTSHFRPPSLVQGSISRFESLWNRLIAGLASASAIAPHCATRCGLPRVCCGRAPYLPATSIALLLRFPEEHSRLVLV
jgi:hypothetical protein